MTASKPVLAASEGQEFVYDSNNKENPYTEVDSKGNTKFLPYNAETNRLWTPEFTSTPEGVQLAKWQLHTH